MYLFRVYTERLDKFRGYIEIFRAYAPRKLRIQLESCRLTNMSFAALCLSQNNLPPVLLRW